MTLSHGADAPTTASPAAFRTLGQNLPEERVIFVFVDMMDSDVPRIEMVGQSYTYMSQVMQRTFAGCPVEDICVPVADRMDRHNRDCHGLARVESFHFYA